MPEPIQLSLGATILLFFGIIVVIVFVLFLMALIHRLRVGTWMPREGMGTEQRTLPQQREAMPIIDYSEYVPARTEVPPPPTPPIAPVAVRGKGQTKEVDMLTVMTDAIARFRDPPPMPRTAALSWSIPLLFDGDKWCMWDLRSDGFLLVCGDTGSGKGNTLQQIAMSVAAHGERDARLFILDAKNGMDYSVLATLPHVSLYTMRPQSGDAGSVSEGCESLLTLLDQYSGVIRAAGARNVTEYTEITGKHLPYTVVLADEIAEFEKDQYEALSTLTRMGRACGFSIIAATQYPTVDTIPSQMQANMPNRLAFRQASIEYTRVALRRPAKDPTAKYEPAYIPRTAPGIGVWRVGGVETLGRAPEITDALRKTTIDRLLREFGRKPARIDPLLPALLNLDSTEKDAVISALAHETVTTRMDVAANTDDNDAANAVNAGVGTDEVALILRLHSQGMSPSNIVKELPKYTPKLYMEFKRRVDEVLQTSAGVAAVAQ